MSTILLRGVNKELHKRLKVIAAQRETTLTRFILEAADRAEQAARAEMEPRPRPKP